jgi:hypothetical protein
MSSAAARVAIPARFLSNPTLLPVGFIRLSVLVRLARDNELLTLLWIKTTARKT